MKISFVGAGRWALTLASVITSKGHEVKIWQPQTEISLVEHKERVLKDFPEGVELPDGLFISQDLAEVILECEIIFFAVPAQALRTVLVKMAPLSKSIQKNKNSLILVSAMKGIENSTYKRMSEILNEFYAGVKIVVLAGPGIPYEIMLKKPTALVTASDNLEAAEIIQHLLTTEYLRVYTQRDVVGTELGGALKNIYAIAGGICDGLKLGDNAKAALLTRGLYEMIRLGIALNANPMTFAGLAGVGDLIVTAYSAHSRNRLLGEKLARGIKLEEIIDTSRGVVEGVATTISAQKLGAKFGIELPIVDAIYEILFKGVELPKTIRKLMSRPLKTE
jgi:glycerol-3-phosphate dehydrogenase (NAD(P)+)